MRLSIAKRERVITIYLNRDLHFKKHRFHLLRQLAAEQDIISSKKRYNLTWPYWHHWPNLT